MGNHQFGFMNKPPDIMGKSLSYVAEKRRKKFLAKRPNSAANFSELYCNGDSTESKNKNSNSDRSRDRRAGSEPTEILSKSNGGKRKDGPKLRPTTLRCSPTVPEALTVSFDLAAAGIGFGTSKVSNADAEAVTNALDAIRKLTPAAPRLFREPIFDDFFEEAERRNLTMEVLQAALTSRSDEIEPSARRDDEKRPNDGRSLGKENLNGIYEDEKMENSQEIEALVSPSVSKGGRLVLIVASRTNSWGETTENSRCWDELQPTIIVQPSPGPFFTSPNSASMTALNRTSGALSAKSTARRGSVTPSPQSPTISNRTILNTTSNNGVRFADQTPPSWFSESEDTANNCRSRHKNTRKDSLRRKTISGMINSDSGNIGEGSTSSAPDISTVSTKSPSTLALSRVILSQTDDHNIRSSSNTSQAPLRKKSLSKSDLFCPPPIISLLKQAQINLIRQLWQQIYNTKGPTVLGNHIFQRVFFKNPQIRDVFRNVDVGNQHINVDAMCRSHAKAVAGILDDVVRNLENLREVEAKLMDVGRKHAIFYDLGFHINFWSVFAEAFIDCTLEWGEKNRRVEESRKAWAIIIAYITDKMKFGFQEARRSLPRPGRRMRQSEDSDGQSGSGS